MKKLLFILILIMAWAAKLTAQDIVMDYPRLSEHMDTVFVDFKLMNDSVKMNIGSIDKSALHLEEVGYRGDEDITLVDLLDIRDYDPDYAVENYSIIVLADRSVSEECLEAQRNAMSEMFQGFPKAKFYVTAMDASRTPTTGIKNIYQLNTWVDSCFSKPSTSQKFIYKAIASVIEEIDGSGAHDFYPEVAYNKALLDSTKKVIVVLTDGKYIDDKGSYIGGDEFFRIKTALISGLDPYNAVQINHIYFGDKSNIEAYQKEVTYILQPGDMFYSVYDFQTLKENMVMRPNPDAMDYRMVLINPPHKLYDGQKLTLHAYINLDEETEAYGVKLFTLGSMLHPMAVELTDSERVRIAVECIFAGLFSILLIYLLFRIIVPRCKNWFFHKRYVKTFVKTNILPAKASDYVAQKCYFCKDDFVPGDTIVTKCEHTMHYDCWKQNGHKCPEYGKECKDGHFFYDEDHPWDKRNAPYYLKSLVIGSFVGLVAWLLFRLFTENNLFMGLIKDMMALSDKVGIDASGTAFIDKIHDMLFFGLMIGFCLTLGASWLVERRKKTVSRVLIILLRGILGAIGGFLSGLICSLLAISTGMDHNCFIIDIVLWLLMGAAIGFVISYKTHISIKRMTLGGFLLAMTGFCVLYLFNFDDSNFSFQYLGQLVSFLCMIAVIILSGGLFALTATRTRVSERYFLHIEGSLKPRDVAIYKWMNRIGGYRMVTIGKDERCYIDMEWDDSQGIDGVQAEVYMENDEPYFKMMSDNKAVRLKHGSSFIVGKTVFTYLEKDCI